MGELRLQSKSQGDLSHREWRKEGDHLFLSARHMRASLLTAIREIHHTVKFEEQKTIASLVHEKIGAFPKASMLLIGYSIEMYLKSGLAKLLIGCSEDLFRSELMGYSHNLNLLADALYIPLGHQDKQDLENLSRYVKNDARYPVSLSPDETYSEAFNKRSILMSSARDFRRFCALARRIKERVSLIDSDTRVPAFNHSWTVDGDGYLAFRMGGNLPPQVTVRYSSIQKNNAQYLFENMKEVALANSSICRVYWSKCKFYEDKPSGKRRRKRVAIIQQQR